MKQMSCAACAVLLLLAFQTSCKDTEATAMKPESSGGVSLSQPTTEASVPNPLRNAYFGDLHLHTSYSMDAFAFGTRTTPEDSCKYAMGETVEYMGKPVKRIAPLR